MPFSSTTGYVVGVQPAFPKLFRAFRRRSIIAMVAGALAAILVGCAANQPVGDTITHADGFTVSTVWTGNNNPVPAGARTGSAAFSGVACASTGPCFAVGSATYASDQSRTVPLLESLTGSRLAISAAPFPGRFGEWDEISCAAKFCAVLGSIGSSTNHPVLVADVLKDGRWHATRIPTLPRDVSDLDFPLDYLSCASDHVCVAAVNGSTAADTNAPEVLVLTDNTWTISGLPVPTGTNRPLLNPGFTDVECASAHRCVLLGDYGDEYVLDVLSDGKWTSTESATTNYFGATCNPASCVVYTAPLTGETSTADEGSIWPVYLVAGGGTPKEVALLSPSPELDDLTCPTSTWCASWLGNNRQEGTSGDQLGIESAGGWKVVQAAPPGRYAQLLYPIQCEAVDVCIAAGASARSSGPNRFSLPLIDTLNHGHWQPTTITLPESVESESATITSIACNLALKCVALGTLGDNLGA